MKKASLLALVVASLAACSPKQEAAAAPEQPANPATTAPADAAPAAGATAPATTAAPLPNGFVLPFDHTIVRDKVAELDGGKQQRRLLVEVYNPDMKALQAQLDSSLAAAGYKAGKPVEKADGTSVNYRKDGKVELVVSYAKGAPEKKSRPDATGNIRIGWNL